MGHARHRHPLRGHVVMGHPVVRHARMGNIVVRGSVQWRAASNVSARHHMGHATGHQHHRRTVRLLPAADQRRQRHQQRRHEGELEQDGIRGTAAVHGAIVAADLRGNDAERGTATNRRTSSRADQRSAPTGGRRQGILRSRPAAGITESVCALRRGVDVECPDHRRFQTVMVCVNDSHVGGSGQLASWLPSMTRRRSRVSICGASTCTSSNA